MLKNKRFSSKSTSRPSYELYIKLGYKLKIYFKYRIYLYIFFQYYNGDVPSSNLMESKNSNSINNLKLLMEYDYKVFKILLFLYWDLECYLENEDYVKNSLIVDTTDSGYLKIRVNHEMKLAQIFWKKSGSKKAINLGTNLEIREMFDALLDYDIYSKIYCLDNIYKNHINIEYYKLYKEINDKNVLIYSDIVVLEQGSKEKIDSSYYQGYIDSGYKEWLSKRKIDLTLNYRRKLPMLKREGNKLFLELRKL